MLTILQDVIVRSERNQCNDFCHEKQFKKNWQSFVFYNGISSGGLLSGYIYGGAHDANTVQEPLEEGCLNK